MLTIGSVLTDAIRMMGLGWFALCVLNVKPNMPNTSILEEEDKYYCRDAT